MCGSEITQYSQWELQGDCFGRRSSIYMEEMKRDVTSCAGTARAVSIIR